MEEKLFPIIDGIIEDLVSQNSVLENALLKTQVLAFKLKNKELKSWINKELNGYESHDIIPNYRIIPTQIKGDLFQGLGYGGHQQLLNTVLPIESLGEDGNFLRTQKFGERISQLTELSKSKNGLIVDLPYSFLVTMSRKIKNWEVIKAWKVIPSSSVTGILSTIKSNLLNFLLELKEELGDEKIPLMNKKKEIRKLIDRNIGQIKADNVNISIGDKNLQNLTSGNNSKTQLSTGDVTNQKIEESNIQELIKYVKENIDSSNLEESDKEDLLLETKRVEKQLEKPKPSIIILNQSLKVIYDVLTGVTGNAYTSKVLEWITQLGSGIG